MHLFIQLPETRALSLRPTVSFANPALSEFGERRFGFAETLSALRERHFGFSEIFRALAERHF